MFKVVDARVRNGAASKLDLARQQAAVLGLRASIPPLELQERQTLYALAILIGRPPEGFAPAGGSVTALAVPNVAPGLPADLLLRRPDLASAEAQLAAANASVAAARAHAAQHFAHRIGGNLQAGLINFLSAPTLALSLGASRCAAIFDGGRLRGQVDVATSRERELVGLPQGGSGRPGVSKSRSPRAAARPTELLQVQVVEQARSPCGLRRSATAKALTTC